jgi:hypothetical protein
VLSVLFLAVGPAFDFKGGSIADIVQALSAHFATPIAYGAAEPKSGRVSVPWPVAPSGVPLDEKAGLVFQATEIASGQHMALNVERALVFRPIVLPWHLFTSNYGGRVPTLVFPEDPDLVVVADGKVSVKSLQGRYFLPQYLPFKKFGKHVHAHKFLGRYPVAFSNATLELRDFVDALAFAVGGKVVESDEALFIDVDLDVLRSQLVEFYKQLYATSKSRVLKAKAVFQMEASRIVPGEKLRDMVDKQGHSASFEVPLDSAAHRAGVEYTRIYLEEAAKTEERDPNVLTTVAQYIREQGNLRRPFRATFNTNGKVGAMVMFGEENGGISF